MSVPPSWVSPLVDCTSNTPPPNSIMVTSSVPPPKSNTMMFTSSSSCLSIPYARLAAVGSFTSLTTSSPAIVPASFVAVLWLSSKYAGTVITAFSIGSPTNASASFLIFCRISAEISCGVYSFPCMFTFWFVPIFLLIATMVFSGLVTACLLAGSPTSVCPSSVNAT